MPAVRAYADLACRAGLAPAALALAFVSSRWFVASTIVGATSLEQLRQNIDAKDVVLEAGLLAEVERIHLRLTNPAP